MKRFECRGKSSFSILLAALLSTLFLLSACTSPEKAKVEHVSHGEALLKEQKFHEAAIEFRNAVQIDEEYAPAHWGLARAFQGLQRGQEAFDELNRVVRLDPNNLEACVTLGNAYLVNIANSADYLSKADQLAKDVLQKDPNNVEGHILMGGVLFAQKQGEKALAELNGAIRLNPARVESYLSLARFYIITNELPKAEETYKRAIAVNGASALAHSEYGKFLVQADRKAEAEAELRKAVEVEPKDRNSRFVLASYYQVTKQWDQAEATYKALAELDKDMPEGRATLADYYSAVNRMDDAIRIYQELLTKSPDYARGRYRLGEMMLMRGDSKGAMDQVDQLLKKDEHDRQALLLRARVKSQTGDPGDVKAAVEDLKEVLRQEPNSRLGLYSMAQTMFSLNQLEQARSFAGELERSYPDYLPGKLM
ncbi:MAG: tetratricopeptide repeat protein, partial [Acidobacteriota bacterium]|nr:tetratricopeptide repeat protein [Acidobacteriota bacterium]